jgi:hypothetical protein
VLWDKLIDFVSKSRGLKELYLPTQMLKLILEKDESNKE